MSDEKTEAPTARHLAEMRQRGDIAQSAELTQAIGLVLAVYLLADRLPAVLVSMSELMRDSFKLIAEPDAVLKNLGLEGQHILSVVAGDWLSFFGIMVAGGLAVGLAQTRGQVTLTRMKPDLNHLNPVTGTKRIFSKRTLMEVGKGVLKIAILGALLYPVLKTAPTALSQASLGDLRSGMAYLGQTAGLMVRQGALLLLSAGLIDYAFNWRQHQQRMKMSRHEITEEMKNAEGQPMIKAKIRQLMRRWSQRRMMEEIVHSDVIVTNPTHLAIALRYNAEKMGAPVVVAKGKGLIAQQIVKKARELHIPIVQNIPLAHALIRVELDSPVPVALYETVAEILAFVYRMRPATGTTSGGKPARPDGRSQGGAR